MKEHNIDLLTARKNTMQQAVKIINEKYGAKTVSLSITDRYKNMAFVVSSVCSAVASVSSVSLVLPEVCELSEESGLRTLLRMSPAKEQLDSPRIEIIKRIESSFLFIYLPSHFPQYFKTPISAF